MFGLIEFEAAGLQMLPARAQPAASQPHQRAPSRQEISRFDDWTVTCNEFENSPKTRVCSALLRIVENKSKNTVFSWALELNDKKQLVSVLQTPTGVAIAPGVELRIGKSPARKIPFASCEPGRCVATSVLDANLLREMIAATSIKAVIQGSQGKIVEFDVQMKGLDKAYAALTRP